MVAVVPSETEQAKKCFSIFAVGVGREVVWVLSAS